MKARRSWLVKCTATLALGSLASTAALGDVLELSSEGARWVAGGPAPKTPAPDPNSAQASSATSQGEARNITQLVARLPSGVSGSRPSFSPLSRSRVSSNFGYRNHPIGGGRKLHAGVDLAAPTGTPVYATALGVVSGAGWRGGYGILIEIEHADNLQTRYGHLSQVAVQPGQIVEPGELIGYVGSTGRSTGPHLHYEVRNNGVAVDPVSYMRGT